MASDENDGFGDVTRAAMPDDFVTRLLLLRHGEVEGMGAREVRGQRDVGLSERGRAQHRVLSDWVAGHGARPVRVICSDLVRCRELGELVCSQLGLELELEPQLREQHMGAWQGRTWDAISEEEGSAINDYWDDYWNVAPVGGESMSAMAARIWTWWLGIRDGLRGQCVVIVTHAGPIRALLARFMGLDGEQALRFAPPPATCSQVAGSQAGFVIEGLGIGQSLGAAAEKPSGALRIALSGSAGTGKTTLGRALAKRLGLPFIEERMRLRLEAGLKLHELDHNQTEALHRELWQEQRDLEASFPGGFVCDRSSIDYAAFRLHYGFFDKSFGTEDFFEHAIDHCAGYSHVLLFPHGVLPLEADGIRTANSLMQLRFQLTVAGLLDQHITDGRLLRVPSIQDFDARMKWALAELGQ